MDPTRVARTSFGAVLALLIGAGAAVGQPEPVRAPINPAFIDFLDRAMAGTWEWQTDDGFGLGDIPAPFKPRVKLPAGFRVEGPAIDRGTSYFLPGSKLPGIRHQGGCGSCWAFATFGSMETCSYPGDTTDFSENHLNVNHGFDLACCAGGNPSMSTAYLSRYSGPPTEADDPYVSTTCTSDTANPVKHVQEAWWLPNDDPSVLKAVLATHGGIYANYYHDNDYESSDRNAYYYPDSGPEDNTNHGVTIIGYDDDYPRTNFDGDAMPDSNGAWYVRNSWGAYNSQGGNFWVSYEDKFFAKNTVALFPCPEEMTNYSTVFDHDPLGQTVSIGFDTEDWGSSMFETTQNIRLRAVSTYAVGAGMSYLVRVYGGCSAGAPTSGTQLGSDVTGTWTYAGYHTVSLPADCDVAAGQRFSVVVRYTTPDGGTLPLEYPLSNYSSSATASAGESFISSNGTSWDDLTAYGGGYADSNVCIKAFSLDGPLAVRIGRIEAEGTAEGVRVSWETASEVGAQSYRVLRSERAAGPFEPLARASIAAGDGGRYEYTDTTARPGRLYYYRVEELSDRGGSHEHSDTARAVAGSGWVRFD